MSKISELIKEKSIGFVFNLVSLLVIVVVLLLVIWAFAAFIEPSSAPSASNQDFTQNILGADNANNSFSSATVAANADGSVIERLEDLLAKIALNSEIGDSGDAASIASTLFGGQQYIWDNRASFGVGTALDSEVGNASDAASMSTTLFAGQEAIYNQVDNSYSACFSITTYDDGDTQAACNAQACPSGWTRIGCSGRGYACSSVQNSNQWTWTAPDNAVVAFNCIQPVCCLAR